MRLFGYYAWHSVVNQIRKLFKTWVLIFVAACFLIGILFGTGAALLDEAVGEDDEVISDSEVIEDEEVSIQEMLGIGPMELVELVVGGILLAIFVFDVLGADKSGSKIFLPADVNLLFASPMKPQSVLLFRLVTQMGAILFASTYSLCMLTDMLLEAGLSGWLILAVLATLLLTLAIGELLKLLLYTVCSTRIQLKKHIRIGVYSVLLLLVGGYIMYQRASGESYLVAAVGFFNGSVSRFIPLWGWLKGFCMFAIEGNITGALLSLAAIVVGGAVLVHIIWHIKADFYEDAMAKTEETAELLAQVNSEKTGLIKRKKDRSDRLRRDGMHYGSGANVFFFKAMYNRFRFAHFGIFTKTTETYLVAAAGVAALCRFAIHSDGLLPVILTLGVFAFFRALGNPLEEDTQMDHFLLIPENTWRKLLWSLMGGTVNCLLDLLPAVIVAALLLGENLLLALAWLPLIVSVDFFATTVGAFIGLSVPVSAGKMIKQLVQILFIYFGLLPDIAIMAVGLAFGYPVVAAVGCAVINILLGLVFFALTPLFLEPKDGKKYMPEKAFAGNLDTAKKHFSKLGFGTFAILGVGTVAQILLMGVANIVWPQWMDNSWGMWLLTFAPLYLIAVPVGLLLLRKVPVKPLEKHSMKPGRCIVSAIICIFMMYAGNILGTIITALLQLLPGISAGNPILGYATDNSIIPKVLFMVILAPMIEEYIFRKQLIDRMHIYGEKLAVVTSAVMFGLFHGNLSQFFYAFALGLVFGYVYLKTGKLRYSIGLHMFINFLGGVVAPLFIEKIAVLDTIETLDMSALEPVLPWLLGFVAYAFVLIGLAITGLVLLCIHKRRISYTQAELELPKGSRFKTVYVNVGMLLLVVSCVAMILANVI